MPKMYKSSNSIKYETSVPRSKARGTFISYSAKVETTRKKGRLQTLGYQVLGQKEPECLIGD